jgi:hypothetical protein
LRRLLPRACASVLSLILVISSLTAAGTAKAQVRTTLGVSARVMEAGPAWAAARQASQARDAVSAWVGLGRSDAWSAQSVDTAFGNLDLPAPRVTILMRAGRQGEDGFGDREGDTVDPSARGDAVSGTPQSTGSPSTDRTAREPWRVIILVEHVSN